MGKGEGAGDGGCDRIPQVSLPIIKSTPLSSRPAPTPSPHARPSHASPPPHTRLTPCLTAKMGVKKQDGSQRHQSPVPGWGGPSGESRRPPRPRPSTLETPAPSPPVLPPQPSATPISLHSPPLRPPSSLFCHRPPTSPNCLPCVLLPPTLSNPVPLHIPRHNFMIAKECSINRKTRRKLYAVSGWTGNGQH